jgi:hypothetical protein
MAESKTEIERRLDRIEKAITTIASWITQARVGYSSYVTEEIEKILRGEDEGEKDAPSG